MISHRVYYRVTIIFITEYYRIIVPILYFIGKKPHDVAYYLTAIKYTTGLLIYNLKNPDISGMNLYKSRACLRRHPEKKHFKTIKYKSYPLKKINRFTKM